MKMTLSCADVYAAGERGQRTSWWKQLVSAGVSIFVKTGKILMPFAHENRNEGNGMLTAGRDTGNGPDEQYSRNAERLLDTFGNAVLRMAYSYLHNMSDAEDILQETLIRYLKTQPKLAGSEHEKAWLLRVAANLSKNRLEYNRLRDTDELEETLISQEREDLSFLWDAVKRLPDANREAIHLFYYEGYSTGQIAKILNRRESTVRSDLRRGRERLKKILEEDYDFE